MIVLFLKFSCFHQQIIIAILRSCAILGVIETQLVPLMAWKVY